MGWFDFWKRKPKPTESAPAPPAPPAHNTGPYTAEDFPLSNPVPGAVAYGGVTCEEVDFAVIVPRGDSTEQQLALIGLALREWRAANGFVRRIIGLEQLLAGAFPETPSEWFFLPMPPFIERVALVLVAPEANNAETSASLNRALEGLSVAMVVSPGFYSDINR